MDHNPGDQSHLTHLEHSKVLVKSNQMSTERNVLTAATATEIAGTSGYVSPAAALPTMSASTFHGNITVKVEDESMSGQSVHICKRVKKEEYDEEYLVVECDCEECIEKIKVEEEQIEVKREIVEDVKIPTKRQRMNRVPESDSIGLPSHSTVHSTNSIPVKIEYPDEQLTLSSINLQESTAEGTTETLPSTSPSTIHANITVKVEDESMSGQSVQLCKRVKKEEFDEEYLVVECDCEECRVKIEVKEEFDETDEKEFEQNNDHSAHRCTQVKKEEQSEGKTALLEPIKTEFESSCSSQSNVSLKQEFKEEIEHSDDDDDDCDCSECELQCDVKREVDSEDNDEQLNTERAVKRQRSEQMNIQCGRIRSNGGEDDLDGGDQQVGGEIVGSSLNDQVNDDDRENVIREDSHAMNAQVQVDQIEVQPDQEHLSDIDYELEMLRNVFIKPIGNGDQFRCDYRQCGKLFGTDEQKLLAHLKLHTKPFVCDAVECLRRFTSSNAFAVHKKSHTVNVLQCDLPGCVKRFKNFGTLNLHKRDHTDKKVFICEWAECEKVSYSEVAYHAHHLTHSDDGIEEQQLVCDWAECARKFTTQLNLSIHRQLHTGESPFDAHPRPSQQVPTELNFVKQIEPDQLGNRFECGYENCGKRMKLKANLIVHIRTKSRITQAKSKRGVSVYFQID